MELSRKYLLALGLAGSWKAYLFYGWTNQKGFALWPIDVMTLIKQIIPLSLISPPLPHALSEAELLACCWFTFDDISHIYSQYPCPTASPYTSRLAGAIVSIPAHPNTSSSLSGRGIFLTHSSERIIDGPLLVTAHWPLSMSCSDQSVCVCFFFFLAQSPTNNNNPLLFVKYFIFFKTHMYILLHLIPITNLSSWQVLPSLLRWRVM